MRDSTGGVDTAAPAARDRARPHRRVGWWDDSRDDLRPMIPVLSVGA